MKKDALYGAKCSLCGQAGKFLFVTRDKKHGFTGQFPVFYCSYCQIDFICPPDNILRYYASDYSLDIVKDNGIIFKIKRWIINTYFVSRVSLKKLIGSFLLQYIAALPKSCGRILDVGCGSGDILFLLKQVGFECYGIDLNEFAIALARKNGLDNVRAGKESMLSDFQDDFFDCIRGSHVLEHMANPFEFLSLSHKKLKKGGELILSTPNINCFNKMIFGYHAKSYRNIPRHINLFSNKALLIALNKAGFKRVKISYKSIYSDFYDSLFFFLDDKFKILDTKLGKILYRNLYLNFLFLPIDMAAGWLKKGETMTTIAIK